MRHTELLHTVMCTLAVELCMNKFLHCLCIYVCVVCCFVAVAIISAPCVGHGNCRISLIQLPDGIKCIQNRHLVLLRLVPCTLVAFLLCWQSFSYKLIKMLFVCVCGCVCLCLDVNQCDTNHNHCTQRCVILYA